MMSIKSGASVVTEINLNHQITRSRGGRQAGFLKIVATVSADTVELSWLIANRPFLVGIWKRFQMPGCSLPHARRLGVRVAVHPTGRPRLSASAR
jgi:hypothetical protein